MNSIPSRRRLILGVGTVALSLALVACGDTNMRKKADLRVVHASSDAPPVNVKVGKKRTISNLDYAESSGYVEVRTGKRDIVVKAILPGDEELQVIKVPRFNFQDGQRYNVVAINPTDSIDALVVPEAAQAPAGDQVSVAVLHAASDAPAVDVYVTAPDALLNGTMPSFSFDFEGVIDAGLLPAGEVRIRVALAGEVDPDNNSVYDSGRVDLEPFGGERLLISAINSENATEQAASPIKLLVATDIDQLELRDSDTNAGARVLHLSPDAPPVDVFANTGKLISNLAYTETFPGAPQFSSYAGVAADDYVLDVAVSNPTSTVADSIYTAEATLDAGLEYSVVALGNVADGLDGPGMGNAFGLLPIVDDNRAVVTQASVKVLHGAPAAGPVNVYVTPGDAFTDADILAGLAGDPLLAGFEFGALTDYVPLTPNTTEGYDIRVIPVGTSTIAINIDNFPLAAGTVATVIARQPATGGGAPTDFNVVVLTN